MGNSMDSMTMIMNNSNNMSSKRLTHQSFNPITLMPPKSSSVERYQLIARYKTSIADMTTAGFYGCFAENELGEGQWGNLRLEVKCRFNFFIRIYIYLFLLYFLLFLSLSL